MTAPDVIPGVSVVIPVHRTAPNFFKEAIDSVCAQTDPRWELVIVLDAASTDCIEIARAAEARDARVRVIGDDVVRPRGHSAARNLGVRHANAPCIAFLDSDDVFEPLHIERRMALLDAHPEAAMAYGSTLYWHSWAGDTGQAARRDFVPLLGVRPDVVHAPPTLVASFINGTATVPCPSSLLIRRTAFDSVGGFDESFRDLYEDQVFYARIALRMPVVADDEVLDRYRQHPGSMTAQATRSHEVHARLRFLDWLEREVVSVRGDDAILRRAIATERWKLRHPALATVVRLARRGVARVFAPARSGRRDPRAIGTGAGDEPPSA